MCGIAGIYTFRPDAKPIDPQTLEKMRDTMYHRGPDASSSWISQDGHTGFAFRRLSIIDLSAAAMQPMCNEDGLIWVVFNGEIYNHAEIRKELERTNQHHWRTSHSDTEVIVHAYEEWGIRCLEKFRGMFGLAIWDGHTRDLWLVRDRIGIKPLYYALHSDRIVFASEIKAILQDPEQKRILHEEAFYHYLSFLTTPAPQTLFEGIKKVPGGTLMRIDANGNVHEERYWDVLDHAQALHTASEDDIAHMILDELRISVQLRKVSDVPVGVFLSGGIDSSTNAVLFSEGSMEKIKTFTIGYEGDYKTYQNEFSYARLIADKVKSEHYEKRITVQDLLDFLPKMVYLQDEPIADPVCVPVYFVSSLARENGVVVAQVGEGADELFWGYPQWKNQWTLQRMMRLPATRTLSKTLFSSLIFFGKGNSQRGDYFSRNSKSQPIFWSGAEAFSHLQKLQLLSPRLRNKFQNYSSWEVIRPIYERFVDKAWEKSTLGWMSYIDLNIRLPELLLMRVDKMSMGASLEGRVPFLDHKFVELAMSIPEPVKTKNTELKHILKKAVHGIIPDRVINRPKQGFAVPIHEWFMQQLGNRAKQELDNFCRNTDLVDRQTIDKIFNQRQTQQIWYLLNLALWWKEYMGV